MREEVCTEFDMEIKQLLQKLFMTWIEGIIV